MSTRFRAISAFLVIVFAFIFFGLVNYLAARQNATSEESIAALRAEIELLRRREAQEPTGTAGRHAVAPTSMMDDESRAAIIEDVKKEKNRVVKSQKYEEAAQLRDKEKKLIEQRLFRTQALFVLYSKGLSKRIRPPFSLQKMKARPLLRHY